MVIDEKRVKVMGCSNDPRRYAVILEAVQAVKSASVSGMPMPATAIRCQNYVSHGMSLSPDCSQVVSQ
jgi:hypothetical protein